MRLYLVVDTLNHAIIGIFTNRKNLVNGISTYGYSDLEVSGSRKFIEANEANIGVYINNTGFLKLYKAGREVIRIWRITINKPNPNKLHK